MCCDNLEVSARSQLKMVDHAACDQSQESRESLGLHLGGSIIVIDEAHNLVDAVNGAHCAAATVHQLGAAEAQLTAYFERFETKLAAGVCACC